MTHKLIYGLFLSRVRCPPPPYSTSVISSRSLGEALRGSLHHPHHHAVVLTELFPDTLLDRSPGIIIELNVC